MICPINENCDHREENVNLITCHNCMVRKINGAKERLSDMKVKHEVLNNLRALQSWKSNTLSTSTTGSIWNGSSTSTF